MGATPMTRDLERGRGGEVHVEAEADWALQKEAPFGPAEGTRASPRPDARPLASWTARECFSAALKPPCLG